MTKIISHRHHVSGLAAVIAAGMTLAACGGPATDGPARYAQNFSPRVMSDAVSSHHAAKSFRDDACVPDTQTFAADCGGIVRYDGP